MKGIVLTLLFFGTVFCCDKGIVLRLGKLTTEEKKGIVDAHNELRQCIATGSKNKICQSLNAGAQPTAKNMLKMEWDDKLAETAQNWAYQCTFAHNKNYDSRFPCVGQNLGISWSSRKDDGRSEFKETIQRWFDEQKDYTYTRHKRQFPKVVGHYTQVVWASTYKVGCGYIYYKEGPWYKKLHVCNYGPCGNFLGEYPYEAGQPSCSDYNMETSDINGLCGKKEVIKNVFFFK